MSHTVDIPGGKATLRSAPELRQRDRRKLEVAAIAASPALQKFPRDTDPRELNVAELGLTPDEFGMLYDLQDATIFAFLKEWTLPTAMPKTLDEIGDMSAEVYDALRVATAPAGADTVTTDFSPNPEPDSPTEGSGDSETPSKAAPESQSIETQPSTGESSVIADSVAV